MIQEGLEPPALPGSTVFIDALDEARGTSGVGPDAMAAIARWLIESGKPRFRLACREADWRGDADRRVIERACDGEVVALHLQRLEPEDMRRILIDRGVSDAEAFIASAERHGVLDLLGNPLLLELTAEAVEALGGEWPATRSEVYESACRRLADEASEAHRRGSALEPGHIDEVLDSAGTLSAVTLLSGKRSIRVGTPAPGDIDLRALPAELRLTRAEAALRSKVFTIEGGQASPRHRTIAEFLAARAIAKRVEAGLPLNRVLAALEGVDGKPVESLRGLFAWLATRLHGPERQELLRRDPLAVILNGDAAALSRPERVLMLEALSASAAENRWFRAGQWTDHPFGPLATADMAAEFSAALSQARRDGAHLAFVDCLFDALRNARSPIPALFSHLAEWVTDERAPDPIRLAAYGAWKRHCPTSEHPARMRAWLLDISADRVADPEDRLLGALLSDAYPSVVGPGEVLRHFRPRKRRNLIAEFAQFWSYGFLERTPSGALADLANQWVAMFPRGLPPDWRLDAQSTADKLLIATLEALGDATPMPTLYEWLGIGLGEHGDGSHDAEFHRRFKDWFATRPELAKALLAHGYASEQADSAGRKNFWRAHARLRGAGRPRDLLRWIMELATATDDERFAQWALHWLAAAAMDPPEDLDAPSFDEVAEWTERLAQRFPEAAAWLQASWSLSIDDWRADQFKRHQEHRTKRTLERKKRAADYAPLLEAARRGVPASPRLMHLVAGVVEKHFYDIEGETPEARVEDLLGDADDATLALRLLDETLSRVDLPSENEILRLAERRQSHYLRPAALLAAKRGCESEPEAWRAWPDALAKTMAAFWITDGMGEEPEWFASLAEARAKLVAPILIAHASWGLRQRGGQTVTGLWGLVHTPRLRRLRDLALRDLLERFPSRASETARNQLNDSLLRPIATLGVKRARAIIHAKLAGRLDTAQRISWLVASLAFDSSAVDMLEKLTRGKPARIELLGKALRDQGALEGPSGALPVAMAERLIALLAPSTPYEPNWPGGFVPESQLRERSIDALFERLGADPSEEAGAALLRLASSISIGQWNGVAKFQAQAQRTVRREAMFSSMEPGAAAILLANGPPTGPRDLAALLLDHLTSLERVLRHDPSFQLRQLWGRTRPKSEGWCRDFILARLNEQLRRQGVDLQSESRAAADKRMDMRATSLSHSGSRASVPVEAKKDCHADVWIAWREQLQKLYSNEQGSDGIGIYLVFWFAHGTRRSPEGAMPASANEMARLLTERIPEADRHRLRICVIDLSWPSHAKRSADMEDDPEEGSVPTSTSADSPAPTKTARRHGAASKGRAPQKARASPKVRAAKRQ